MSNKITSVLQIDSDTSRSCPECRYWIEHDQLEKGVNHVVAEHNYDVQHIGQQTLHGFDDGKPWHITVAVLSKRVA